jgi:RNA polymerase sigma-70 factor (ECF subfamily)
LNEEEFLKELKQNQGIIYKLVALYASDAEEKKDLCQEIIYQAWKGWPSFRSESKFSTWLYRISINTLLTFKRKKNFIDYQDNLENFDRPGEEDGSRKDEVMLLRKAIRKLSETDRAIISMHLDGYDNIEIATIMGISANNTGVKLHRIKNQLTDLLSA